MNIERDVCLNHGYHIWVADWAWKVEGETVPGNVAIESMRKYTQATNV